jgi:serine/threonine protein kinase
VAPLGKGSMGEVYRADDLALGQPVALKFLPAHLASDPDRLARFRKEVATARGVSHLSVERSVDVCLSCHQAGKPPGDEDAWAVGYQPGMDLSKFWKGFEPEAGKQTAEFWHNGTAHKNRVQGNTLPSRTATRTVVTAVTATRPRNGRLPK